MVRLRAHNIAVSLDGFATGEGQSLDAPFGHAGGRLMSWFFPTHTFVRASGHESESVGGGSHGVDDAFAAAFDRKAADAAIFTVAYVVRAVSPGRYVLPQAYVEDMYRPDRFGRTGTGTVEVEAAR